MRQLHHQRRPLLGDGGDLELELHQLGHHPQVAHLPVDVPGADERAHVLGEELEGLLVVHHGLVLAQEQLLAGLTEHVEPARALLAVLKLLGLCLELLDETQPVARSCGGAA